MHSPMWAITEKFLTKAVNARYVRGQRWLTYRMTSQGKSLMGGTVLRVLRWRTTTTAFWESVFLKGLQSHDCDIVDLRRPRALVTVAFIAIGNNIHVIHDAFSVAEVVLATTIHARTSQCLWQRTHKPARLASSPYGSVEQEKRWRMSE